MQEGDLAKASKDLMAQFELLNQPGGSDEARKQAMESIKAAKASSDKAAKAIFLAAAECDAAASAAKDASD